MGAQPELETHLKYCFQSSKGLVQVRVPLFWFGPLGLGSGFVRERVPVQVRLRTQTPRGGGLESGGKVVPNSHIDIDMSIFGSKIRTVLKNLRC